MLVGDATLIETAVSMRAAGGSYGTIFRAIADQGASDLAMTRAAMRMSGLGVAGAKQLLADEGFPQEEFVVLVDDDDPFFRGLLDADAT